MNEQIVIFKNEKIGDLIHSYNAIKKIISDNKDKKIIIFLSHYNYEMKFLFDYKNVYIKVITEKISILDKLKILLYFFNNKIVEVYILKPSIYFFILPLIFFKKIRYNGICVNKINYYRPPVFLRKFLNNYVINDRGTKKIRRSIHDLHLDLLNKVDLSYNFQSIINKNQLNKDKYLLIHFNKFKFSTLYWGLEELYQIIETLKEKFDFIILTNDLNDKETNNILTNKYSNFENTKVKYLPDVKGKAFFDIIGNAKLVLAFHGMITSIAAIQNTYVIDLFNCKINNKNDFYKYKNAFHEFKPKLKNYEFLIPKKDFLVTINRIKKLIKNGRKINS